LARHKVSVIRVALTEPLSLYNPVQLLLALGVGDVLKSLDETRGGRWCPAGAEFRHDTASVSACHVGDDGERV
jgi:hypothetical protein